MNSKDEMRKMAARDMLLAKKNGGVTIADTKMGVVDLDFSDGLYMLIKDGSVVFQTYEHTPEVFIAKLISRVYCGEA